MGKINGTCYNSKGAATDNYLFYAEYSTGTPSIAENYTPLTVSLKVCRNPEYAYAASSYNLNGVVKVSLTIDGQEVFSTTTAKVDTRNAQVWTFTTKTKNVTHKDDGTKTVNISASISNVGTSSLEKASLSGSVALADIARASVFNVSPAPAKMGEKATITIDRKADSLTHTLTYAFAGVIGTIATGVGESYEWIVPDLASKIPGQKGDFCTITCSTYSGTKLVGTESVTIALGIPGKSTPSASADTVQMGTSVNISTNRKSTGFKHKLTYTMGEASGTISTSAEGSVVWTPPESLASYTNKETSAVCTITCETYTGSTLVGTSTLDITLTVPAATVPVPDLESVYAEETITISLSKAPDAYTHDLTYTILGHTGEIATDVSGDYQWVIPYSMASYFPNSTNEVVTVSCKTRFKDSEVEIGTQTSTFTVIITENDITRPVMQMIVTSVHDLPEQFDDVFVKGKSAVKVSYEASSPYSTIKSYHTELLTNASSDNPYISAVMANSGDVNIAGKVTDARGFSTTAAESITVIDYSKPRIIPGEGENSIVCTRCNSDGTRDPVGVYLLIKIGRKYSKVISGDTQKNYCKLSYLWKTDAAGEDDYSKPVELLAGNAAEDYVNVILPNVVESSTTVYNIQLIAEDDVGEIDKVTMTVPSAFAAFHIPISGHGITFGGYHDPAKYNVFDCRFNAEFQGDVYGRAFGLGALPEMPQDADANDYLDFGVWAIINDDIAFEIKNLPEDRAGTFRVWSANGSGATTGTNVYIMQEYTPYINDATYRRSIQRRGLDSDWEYGPWRETIWQTV